MGKSRFSLAVHMAHPALAPGTQRSWWLRTWTAPPMTNSSPGPSGYPLGASASSIKWGRIDPPSEDSWRSQGSARGLGRYKAVSSFVSGPLAHPHPGHLVLLGHELWPILGHGLLTLGRRMEQSVTTALRAWPPISAHPYFTRIDSAPPQKQGVPSQASSSLE